MRKLLYCVIIGILLVCCMGAREHQPAGDTEAPEWEVKEEAVNGVSLRETIRSPSDYV